MSRPVSRLRLVLAAGAFVVASQAAVVDASAAGRLCDGRQVVVDTVRGAAMTAGIARDNPAAAQLAALVAAVEPTQQEWAKREALRSLRERGQGNQDIFDLLYMQAKSGQQVKRFTEGASGAVLGAIGGAVAGTIVGRTTEGMLGGGALGAYSAFAARQGVAIVADSAVVQPVFRRLVRNPCEISATEALEQIRRLP